MSVAWWQHDRAGAAGAAKRARNHPAVSPQVDRGDVLGRSEAILGPAVFPLRRRAVGHFGYGCYPGARSMTGLLLISLLSVLFGTMAGIGLVNH